MQLLKALVALGGSQVTEQRLIDALWPNEDGDKAHTAFSTTLNRLRKLVGPDAIILSDGRLSLDSKHCWVDVWSFEDLLRQMEEAKKNDDWKRFAQNALALYRDHFMAADGDESWAIALRERLRQRYLKTTTALAGGWQSQGDWQQALSCYQRGLEVDNLAEGFYQGLMRCYHQLGLKSEALDSYYRCKRMLSISLSVKPW